MFDVTSLGNMSITIYYIVPECPSTWAMFTSRQVQNHLILPLFTKSAFVNCTEDTELIHNVDEFKTVQQVLHDRLNLFTNRILIRVLKPA